MTTSAPPPPSAPRSGLDRFFEITAHGSTIPREIRAGLTTFLTMSYILFVNPQVLSAAIPVPNSFAQILTATAIAAAFGSLAMGLVARYPFAQAPGMGLNAFFAFTVVLGLKVPWQTALGAVFISGLLFVLLSLLGARQAIVQAIPQSIKFAITGGIGAFLAFLGFKSAGIVVTNPATFLGLGNLTSPGAWLARPDRDRGEAHPQGGERPGVHRQLVDLAGFRHPAAHPAGCGAHAQRLLTSPPRARPTAGEP